MKVLAGGLADLLRVQAAAGPDRTALIFKGQAQSYGELDARSSRIANGLRAAGVRPGDRVAILGANSDAWVEAMFGILKAGAVTLAVNWRLAVPEIAYILRHGRVRAIFYDLPFADAVRKASAAVRPALSLPLSDLPAWSEGWPAVDPSLSASPHDVALQMYTSGTTGLPKGVQLTHANYMAGIDVQAPFHWGPVQADELVLAPAPFFHVNGVNPVLRAIAGGARLMTVQQFRPPEVLETIARDRVTRTTMAPAMIQACLDLAEAEPVDLSSLRVISYGGSPITETVLERARNIFGCGFAQAYGMTESTGGVTFLAPEDHAPGRDLLRSCGRASPSVEVRVVRPDGRVCAPREVGEVVIRGDVVTPGYFNDPRATAEAIRDGWLHTGDAAWMDEGGYLFIHDRLKDMIVSGAENVYPAEVENALASHPDVADVAVIGVPDPRWGEAVKAIVVLRSGADAGEADLIAHARERIAAYKAPKSVDFVAEIPRNASGKILRRALREPYWGRRTRQVN